MALPYRNLGGGRWSFYLLLSFCVNGLVISHVALNPVEIPVFDLPVLKVNLFTLAKPMIETKPKPSPELNATIIPSATVPAIVKPIVTHEQAIKKVVLEKPVSMPQRKPNLDLPIEKQVRVEMPVVKSEKLLELPVARKARHLMGTEKQPNPETEIIEKLTETELTVSDSSGKTGSDDSTVINEANYRHQTPPAYPRRALNLGQQGTVTLHAQVLPNGSPGELKIAHSSGYRLLDRAAISAVKKWKFEPTSVDGTAIVSWVRVPVNFIIQ